MRRKTYQTSFSGFWILREGADLSVLDRGIQKNLEELSLLRSGEVIGGIPAVVKSFDQL